MPDLTSLSDLQPHPRNPREITPEALAGLGASLEQSGDLSGIVWNSRSGTLVCGHQRIKALGEGAKLDALAVAWPNGHDSDVTLHDCGVMVVSSTGERFPVRVVDWDEQKHLAAMVVANSPHIAGGWLPELGGVLDELAGPLEDAFFALKLDELRADVPLNPDDFEPVGEGEQPRLDQKAAIQCPVCGARFRPDEQGRSET